MIRICPILLLCLTFCVAHGQQLVNDVIGSSGEQITNSAISLNHTTGEFVSSTINNTEITLTQGFQQTAQLLYLNPKAILQGPSLGTSDGLMRDDLRSANYIPFESPYDTHVNESQNAFLTTGDDAIVDWIQVKLRNADLKVVSEKSALVQRDGDIVAADGISPIQFTAQNNDYFVEVNHRNHLGTMTKNQIGLTHAPSFLDFTDGLMLSYGNNSRVQLTSGKYALWAGDSGINSDIKFSGPGNDSNIIKDFILSDPGNFFNFLTFSVPGYNNEDVNLDGVSKFSGTNNDSNVIKDNVLAHPGNFFNFLTYTINSTTPPNN